MSPTSDSAVVQPGVSAHDVFFQAHKTKHKVGREQCSHVHEHLFTVCMLVIFMHRVCNCMDCSMDQIALLLSSKIIENLRIGRPARFN